MEKRPGVYLQLVDPNDPSSSTDAEAITRSDYVQCQLSNGTDGNLTEKLNELDKYNGNIPTTADIGGIKAGTNLDGMTIYSIIHALTHPYIHPTGSIAYEGSTVYEKRDSTSIIISGIRLICKAGSKAINKYTIYNGETVVCTINLTEENSIPAMTEKTIDLDTEMGETTITITNDATIKVVISDGEHEFTTNEININIVEPVYYGSVEDITNISSLENLTKELYTLPNGNEDLLSVSYSPNNQYMILVLDSSKELTVAIDQNGFNITDSFESINDTIDNKEYIIYYSQKTIQTNFSISFLIKRKENE